MTIQLQRNYSSPNCMLSLQGFKDDSGNFSDTIPVISVLTVAQCQIIGCQPILTGGKDFLVNLIKAVNAYAQGFLSGVHHPHETETKAPLIMIEKLPEKNRHLLIWQEDQNNSETKVQLELTTVQLFDLVEAIDQFLADSRTLADLTLDLQPLSRRYRQAEENILQQSTPAALGLLGFALAAIALFLIPIPSTIKDPRLEDKKLQNNTTETVPEKQFPLPNPQTQSPPPQENSLP